MAQQVRLGLSLRRPSQLFIFITVFVDLLGYGMVLPLLPFYVREYSSGALMVGVLGSLYALVQFFSAPLLGGISDRQGRRPVLICCLFGASLAYVLLGLAQGFWSLCVAVALAGMASGSISTAQAYVADSTAPEERARALGMIGAAFGLGMMAGPALGGLLSANGLGAPAFGAAALALGNALFGLSVLPESLPRESRSATPALLLNPVSQLAALLGMARVRAFLLTVFLLNLSFVGLLSNFPLFSNVRFGWDPAANAYLFAFVGVCAVFTQGVLLGRLQPRFGEAKLVVAGLALMALNLTLVALIPRGWMLYPVVGLLAAGTGLSIPSVTALISRRIETGQGKIMGGMQSILSLTMITGPVIVGLTFDGLGASAPYLLGSLLATAALAAFALALRAHNARRRNKGRRLEPGPDRAAPSR